MLCAENLYFECCDPTTSLKLHTVLQVVFLRLKKKSDIMLLFSNLNAKQS